MRPRRIGIFLLAALVVLCLPTAAVAKKKHKSKLGPVVTVSQTQAVPIRGARAGATATCPAKTVLVGGGFASSPFFASGGSNFVTESHASGANGWTASASDANGANVGSITAEAYCRKGAKPLTQVSATSTLAGYGSTGYLSGSQSATCPSGSAVAGGFASDANIEGTAFHGPLPTSSFPSSSSAWRVDAFNTSPDPANFTAYAYCSKAARIPVSASASFSGAGTRTSVDAPQCPQAKKKKGKKKKPRRAVLAGGFQVPLDLNTDPATGAFVAESHLVNGLWHVGGVSVDTGSASITAYGLCG